MFNNELKTNQTLFQNFTKKADQKSVGNWLQRLYYEESIL